jgi:HCOMODA/2-hydroxy-3-carboxy-muconic semialdehyde decarboxylase
MVYTRKQAIPEAGGAEDTGPSGRVERINRFAAYFNHLGARDLARVSRATEPHTRDPNSDQALIQDLVIANRLMASDDIGVLTPDGLAHVSVRSRANPNHYFIAHDVSPGMVTAADIIENDLDSVPVREDQRALPQYSERYIHGEIYKTRPDITAILHAHTPELVTFGKSSATLRPVLNTALFIGDGLPIYDLTKFTGGAPSLRALVSRAYNFRMNAKIQALAIGLGGTVGGFEKNVASNAAADSYPEWDYWQQQVLGSAAAIDPTVAYTPPSGLPTRRQ